MTKHKITVTSDMYDNRDEYETYINLGPIVLIVDPVELFKNMIENCIDQSIVTKLKNQVDDILGQVTEANQEA